MVNGWEGVARGAYRGRTVLISRYFDLWHVQIDSSDSKGRVATGYAKALTEAATSALIMAQEFGLDKDHSLKRTVDFTVENALITSEVDPRFR